MNWFFSCDIKMTQSFKNSPETAGTWSCWMNPKAEGTTTDQNVKEKRKHEQDFSTSELSASRPGEFFVVGDCPALCKMFNSIPGLHLLDASSTALPPPSPVVTIRNVSKHRLCCLESHSVVKNHRARMMLSDNVLLTKIYFFCFLEIIAKPMHLHLCVYLDFT